MPLFSLFITSMVPELHAKPPNRTKPKLRFCRRRRFLSPSGAAIFLILFLSSQTTHLLLLLFSCFCFSHPKHRKPTELNRNRIQSVDPVFFPYQSISMLNMLNSKFSIRCKNCLQHRLSMLKPKFSVRCKNCLQHRPTRTDYTPRTTTSEQEEGGEQEEEQSSSEEEQVEAAAKIESLASTPLVKPHSSSSGSETQPMEPESTPVKVTQARFTRSSTMKKKKKKRPNSETETTPSKRVKKKDPDPKPKSQGGGEEKKLFQRLWSNDNEIELLKGMLDYRAIHGSDTAANVAAFYEFVKKSLHVEVTKVQLVDKMKRLRKKYRNNAGRGKKGKDPTFLKPHERKTYELSKKIWGCAAADGVSGRCLNGMLSFNKNVVLEESMIKRGLELFGQQKRLELEERCKRVELAELQMYVTQAELISYQASLILEAYKGH